jgi:hypothetical protein
VIPFPNRRNVEEPSNSLGVRVFAPPFATAVSTLSWRCAVAAGAARTVVVAADVMAVFWRAEV